MKEETEMKELDMNKYLVLKWDDIREQPLEVKEKLAFVQGAIETYRHGHCGKKDNKYLVLNLDDEIDADFLLDAIRTEMFKQLEIEQEIINKLKVSDIALALVNAIQKAKETQ